jgi:hypothetical protein
MANGNGGKHPSPGQNLRIWNAYAATDPRHTKQVSYGRKFTAIDTYYQIMRATEAFGPWGEGWGWTSENETVVALFEDKPLNFAKVTLELWYMQGDVRCVCGAVVAMNLLVSAKGVPDEEAFKKATTDACTKALSYLGFSADVFMGKFDDNRYVQNVKAEFEKKDQAVAAVLPPEVVAAISKSKTLTSVESLSTLFI